MTFLVESIVNNGKTEIVLFYRDENNNKYMKRISDFKPYFYVDEKEHVPQDNRIYGVQNGFISIDNKQVKKIIVHNSYDIKHIREYFINHYESDISPSQRYIIDHVGEVKTYPLKILSIDIELNTEHDFPDMQFPNQEVTSVALTDSMSGKSICLLYQPDNAEIKLKTNEQLKVYNTEEKLLDAVIHYVNSIDPDVITGWNVKAFDLTYLVKRMKSLGVDYTRMSPLGQVSVNDKYEDVRISGRIVMDMMGAYKYFRGISNQGKAESYSLEFTAQDVLGVGKIKHIETFSEMWKKKPQKLVEYNIRDNELVDKINKKLKIVSFFDSIRAKACSNMESIFHTSTLVDGLLLNVTKGNPVLPSKKNSGGEKYTGAFVIEPKPGLYEFVLALDIKSMYPNLIKTFNMGYETLDEDGEIRITDNIAFSHKEGFIPRVLTMLAEERAMYKKRMKEAKTDDDKLINHFRQYAVKVLANSVYGYLGYPRARLYKRDVAYAVTYMGQKLIKHTKKIVEDAGFKVIYGDTDSIYVKAKSNNPLLAIKEGYKLVNMINEEYKKFAEIYNAKECFLEMEFEKAFKKILFVAKRGEKELIGAKKRYAYKMLWKDGKYVEDEMEISGFDSIRCLAGSTEIIIKQRDFIRKTKISDLEKTDITEVEILNEYGKFVPIKNLYISNSNKLLRMRLKNGAMINATPTHKFLVKRGDVQQEVVFEDILLSDKIPISNTSEDLYSNIGTYDFGRFIGLYLAEGSKTQYCVKFSFGAHEHEYIKFVADFAERTFARQADIRVERTQASVIIHSSGLSSFISDFVCGDNCYTKHLSSKAFRTSHEFKKGVIDGVIQGDGDINEMLTSTSNKLINDIAIMMSLVGQNYTRYKPRKSTTKMHTIKGVEIKEKSPIYRIRRQKNSTASNTFNRYYKHSTNGITWMDIDYIEKNTDTRNGFKVFDIEVDSDSHLFRIANGIITHNSDTPRVAKNVQKTVLEMILDGVDKDTVVAFIKELDSKIRKGEISAEEIGFPKGITENLNNYKAEGPVIRGALYSNKYLGTRFGKGSKPKFLYIKAVPPGYPHTNVITYEDELPDGFIPDYDKINERIFEMKLRSIFESIGWDWADINSNQHTMGDWIK